MIIANPAASPSFIHAVDSNNQNVFPIGTPEVDINLSDELQFKGLPDKELVSAVKYNPTEG